MDFKFASTMLVGTAMLAGCLGSHPAEPFSWTVEADGALLHCAPQDAKRVKARLRDLSVRAPYDGARIVVMRADGSFAFDPCNSFAARPPLLLKGIAKDALEAAVPADFAVEPSRAEVTFDVEVSRIALDCRSEGSRKARVSLALTAFPRGGEGRAFKSEASADAADGNYTKAFSQAFADALGKAAGDFTGE
ncbi:MAG: hypothetical protein K6F50_06545 [Kiritimatiellae bacterium]|nr:hypothetical protein [Kiritimatiellia bacterium]